MADEVDEDDETEQELENSPTSLFPPPNDECPPIDTRPVVDLVEEEVDIEDDGIDGRDEVMVGGVG